MNMSNWIKKLLFIKQEDQTGHSQGQVKMEEISGNIQKDFSEVKRLFSGAEDFSYRELHIHSACKSYLIYLSGLVDMDRLETHVIDPLLKDTVNGKKASDCTIDYVYDCIHSADVSKGNTIQILERNLLSGAIIFLMDGSKEFLVIQMQSWDFRSVQEPATEDVVYGPRESFNESIKTNASMIRRRLKTTKLKMENVKIGTLSQTEVMVIYLENIADPSVVEEVRSRLKGITIDAIEDSGYILELIEDNPKSVFPQILQTERPDRVVGNILEGKIGILVENSPFALVAPCTFFNLMTSPEDYYGRYMITSFIRCLRYLFLLIALMFPAIYISVTTFHTELLPTNLLYSVATSREQVPFPAFVEALLMEITFEALREAGLRLPKPIGQTVSIVGALVIGEAAVTAGIVSAPLVIVVATTGIASFMFPSYSFSSAIRLLRFMMIFLAGNLGFYGILLGVFFILIHLVQLRSFGVPYLSPIVEFNFNNLKDLFIRVPWWQMDERPAQTGKRNLTRSRIRERKY